MGLFLYWQGFNKSLLKWFPCSLQEEFILNEDNPPYSKGKEQLCGTESESITHCKSQKDIRHKLIMIYLERLLHILFPVPSPEAAIKFSPKPGLKRTHKARLKVHLKAGPKVGLKSPPQTVPKGAMKPAPKFRLKTPPKTGAPPSLKPGRKATLRPGVIGLSPAQLIQSDSEKEPESIPENQEVMDMAVDVSQATSISKEKKLIPKKKTVSSSKSQIPDDYYSTCYRCTIKR